MKNMIEGGQEISFDEREVIITTVEEIETIEVAREGRNGLIEGVSKEDRGTKDGEVESTETLIEDEEIVLDVIMK